MAATSTSDPGRDHLRRIAVIWAGSSIVGVILVVFLLGPHMPPGRDTAEASDQTTANILLSAICTPIMLAIWVYFIYAIAVFRRRPADSGDGPPDHGSSRVQLIWVAVTGVVVLFLAIWGSVVLLSDAEGAGGGQGPSPLVTPSGPKVQVQVIGQQWQFTYRYPQYGGFASAKLVLPESSTIEFHVTSLDVTHSFWAYQLGVKADAVPGADNIAFVHTTGRQVTFDIRCAELCGLWHGNMFDKGRVVSKAAFRTWVASMQRADAPVHRFLGPYQRVYVPDPTVRGG
jgi:cytochrome c oxidase subunit II